MTPLPPRLFVTGTDTDVGKSVVTAALAATLAGSVAALKPVASGVPLHEPGADASLLGRAAGHEPRSFRRFAAPLSPHRAAALEGETTPMKEVLEWIRSQEADYTLVEGVGGWRVPMDWDWSVSDLAVAWAAPVLVVAPNRLGVLNHVRLTVESIAAAGLPLWGLVLNEGVGPEEEAARRHNQEDLVQLLPGVRVRSLSRMTDLENATLAKAGAEIRRP